MKRILTSLLMAVGITGPFVSHLVAQTNREVAKVPFAFIVSNRSMPAGTYTVSELKTGSPVFLIKGSDNHSVFVQLNKTGNGAPENPSLTFACYGKDCVLAKVTPPNSSSAFGLSRSAIEKNLSHKLGMASMVAIKLTPR